MEATAAAVQKQNIIRITESNPCAFGTTHRKISGTGKSSISLTNEPSNPWIWKFRLPKGCVDRLWSTVQDQKQFPTGVFLLKNTLQGFFKESFGIEYRHHNAN